MMLDHMRSEATPGTRLLRRAKANPELAAALAQVPEWETWQRHLDDLTEQAAALPAPTEDDAVAVVLAALDDGRAITPKMLTELSRPRLAVAEHVHAQKVLSRAASALLARRDAALAAGTPSALSALHEALVSLIDEHRSRAGDAPTSAQHAIDTGTAEQWQAILDARARYAALRQAQIDLTGLLDHPDPRVWHAAYLANAEQAWPDLPAAIAGNGRRRRRQGGGFDILTAPWPDDPRDHAAWLDYLAATPEAEAWIPTPAQLDERLTALADMARSAYAAARV